MKKIIFIIVLILIFSILWLPSSHIYGSLTSDQSGTLTFDNSNSELGCSVWASITIKRKDNKNRELESGMILSPSTSYMDENPTQFNITFNFDQGTITGDFNGIYYRKEEGEAYDSAEISANISNGTVTWDADQGVWLFDGDVEMEVSLDMRNKLGSDGEEIFYGDANIKANVVGEIIGGSGQHEALDHHGDLQSYGAYFNILYEGELPPATGSGELRVLTIDCWLAIPFGEDMESKFPFSPGSATGETDPGEDEEVDQNETVDETQDNFILSDLNDQLGLFIANHSTDKETLHQWEGWNSLNDTQKINLENIINKLDTIFAENKPLSDMGQAAMNDVNRQAAFEEQTGNLVDDELDVRKNIRDTVWNETLRDKFGDTGVYIYKNYQIFKDVKGVYDAGANWINDMKDPDTAATEIIKKDSLSAVGANKTPQEFAKDAIGYINTIATASSVFHYAYYREVYDKLIKENETPDKAHKLAMDALRKRVKDFTEGEFGNINNRLEQKAWGPATGAALESGGIYDKAFPALVKKNIAPPKV